MKKAKVFFVLPHLGSGGAEKVTQQIFKYFQEKTTLDVTLLVLSGHGTAPGGVEFLQRPRLRWAVFTLSRKIFTSNPDVVFSTLGYITIFLCCLKYLTPFRLIARESNTLSEKLKEMPWWMKAIYRFSYRYLYSQCDVIITQSQVMNEDLKKYLSPATSTKTQIIHNFIENSDARLHTRTRSTTLRLLAVGRLTRQKGFDLLIEQLAELKNEVSCTLDIYGEGEQKLLLQKLIHQHQMQSKITLKGINKEIHSLLTDYDFLVIPSRYEGFSNIMLEALSIGLPVIIRRDIGGQLEAVQDGVNGFVYDGTLEDLRRTLISSVHFDAKAISTKTQKLFNAAATLHKYRATILGEGC